MKKTHIILATDNAIDKVFRDTETLIDSSKPKSEGAVSVFPPQKTAFGIFGLITVTKYYFSLYSSFS